MLSKPFVVLTNRLAPAFKCLGLFFYLPATVNFDLKAKLQNFRLSSPRKVVKYE